jgi:NADPH-dependent curcumin reductase CurA
VVASRSPHYSEGDVVFGMMQWSDYFIARSGPEGMMTVPRQDPLTAYLSVLGVTGLTAYFGMLDVGQAKEGETVVVSGAAGAVGSVAGQIAKIIGCRVVGIAGGPEKCAWLSDELGFDAWIDYKAEDVGARLRETCPEGIDVFFDNVGGEHLEAAIGALRLHGRAAICGSISTYNAVSPPPGPRNMSQVVATRLTLRGFLVGDHTDLRPEFLEALPGWIASGDLVVRETVREGLEDAVPAFLDLLRGGNTGKMVVRVSAE